MLLLLAFVPSARAQVNQEKTVTVTNANGKEEQIDLPTSMTEELDSTTQIYKAKNYLTRDPNCNMPDVNQELFDQVYGEGNVKDEADFRQKVADSIKAQFANDEEFKFMLDLRKYAENKVGELTFPEELLKRIMKSNNPDKDDKFIEDNFAASVNELKWSLIKDSLLKSNNVKVDKDDVLKVCKDVARMQFAQYGMSNVPDEYLDNYVQQMMKDEKSFEPYVERASDVKLAEALKKVVKLNEKTVSLDEFNKLMSEK